MSAASPFEGPSEFGGRRENALDLSYLKGERREERESSLFGTVASVPYVSKGWGERTAKERGSVRCPGSLYGAERNMIFDLSL